MCEVATCSNCADLRREVIKLQQQLKMSVFERFWLKVAPPDENGCRLWMGAVNRVNGYGQFRSAHVPNTLYAHRASYVYAYGEIPDGMYVCHRCDIRLCVSPEHLFIGTPNDNVQDKVSKGRHLRKLSVEQLAEIRGHFQVGAAIKDIACLYGLSKSRTEVIVKT